MRRIYLWFLPALVAVAVLLPLSSTSVATHVRPKAATPHYTQLVVAYRQCPGGPLLHGPPFAVSACMPVQSSPFLTTGTPDANGAAAQEVGFQQQTFVANPPTGVAPPEDIRINFQDTDVRCQPGAAPCGPPNGTDGPDYTGELLPTFMIRITSHWAGAAGGPPNTAIDVPFSYRVPCVATGAAIGSTCAILTTWNTVIPGSAGNEELQRANIEFGQLEVFDGGPDGAAGTVPNEVFKREGMFIP
jgi:hypothetical protein